MWQPSPPLNGGAWLDQLEGLATTLLRLGKQSDHSIWSEIKTELKIKVKKPDDFTNLNFTYLSNYPSQVKQKTFIWETILEKL